jgi:hypothetical protein
VLKTGLLKASPGGAAPKETLPTKTERWRSYTEELVAKSTRMCLPMKSVPLLWR